VPIDEIYKSTDMLKHKFAHHLRLVLETPEGRDGSRHCETHVKVSRPPNEFGYRTLETPEQEVDCLPASTKYNKFF
jgi:hypothetical protein